MTMLKTLMRVTAAAALAATLAPAMAQDVIKIGEINSYKAQPAFLEPYKKGMELAVDEINAAGGLLGKKVQLVIRDDNGNPGDAVRAAEELVSREKVDVLTGSFLSHVGLALTDFAKQKKFFFLAGEPLTDKIVWQNGNRYTYRLRPSTYMQVSMMVPDAVALKKKRWALVYPNYEYGQSAVATFKQLLKAAQPSPMWSSSSSRRRRWARSTRAAWCRPWPMPSPTPSSTCCSVPTCPSSCAKATRAACSRTEKWSAC
jgi:branched-chain amino acid transport system substrate-binding protein